MRRFSKADVARMKAGKLPAPTEDEIQRTIVDGLKCHGYIVLVTSRRKLRCAHCGKVSHTGDRADKGIPDLLVRRPEWFAGRFTGLEVKRQGPIKWSSNEQKILAESGQIIIVQSLEEAVAAMERQV